MRFPSPGSFAVTTTRTSTATAPFTVLSVAGELDMASAPRLREAVDAAASTAGPHIVLDLHAVTFCDCRGLAAFAAAHSRCAAHGGWLALASPSPQLSRILSLTGLMARMPVYPTLRATAEGIPVQPGPRDR